MTKKAVQQRPVGRPAGSTKDGTQDAHMTFRHTSKDRKGWERKAKREKQTLRNWIRNTLNAVANE